MSYVPRRVGDGGDYTAPRHDWPVSRGTKMLYGKATGGELLRVVYSPPNTRKDLVRRRRWLCIDCDPLQYTILKEKNGAGKRNVSGRAWG